MKTIYLIGFMGSGKTTIGKALSEKLMIPVFDTDQEISHSTGKTVSKIFEEDGEVSFRLLEKEILKKLPIVDSIVTTGGGIILREENREWMKINGEVVFLYATPKEILKRLEGDQSRPLLRENKATNVQTILEERMELYLESANIIIDTTGKSVTSIIQELELRLKNN